MSDTDSGTTVETTSTKGYTTDPDGDLSSGRLAKLVAIWTSVGVAVSGFATSAVALFNGKMDGSTFTGFVIALVGLFLGVALGNEITQKVTGK